MKEERTPGRGEIFFFQCPRDTDTHRSKKVAHRSKIVRKGEKNLEV
jgi:hypothetical protein